MPQTLPRLDHCLNCGEPAAGNFCSNCGQENENQTVALRPLVADLLADVASFDSRLVRTIRPLFLRPGFLTTEYNRGRRASYLSPVKLYLVASLLFFLLLSWQNGKSKPLDRTKIAEMSKSEKLKPMRNGVSVRRSGISVDPGQLPATVEAYEADQKALPPEKRDGNWHRLVVRQSIKLMNDPASFVRGMQDNFARMMFVLLPLFALLLKLLYVRSGRLYVEHLIFALHGHSFVFLMLTLDALIPWKPLGFVLWSWMLVYLFKAMRTVYQQSRAKTGVKYVLLGGTYVVLLFVSMIAIALLTLLLI